LEKAKIRHKLIKKLKDDKFEIDHLQEYSLIIQIGIRDIQVLVVDSRENRCLIMEDFVLAKIESIQEWRSVVEQVFDSHHVLKAGFWKSVRIVIKNQKFSHIPASLFVPEALPEYLSINCKINPDTETLLYYKSVKSDAVTAFAVDTYMYNWLNNLYPNSKIGFLHQSSCIFEGILNYSQSHKGHTMYLYIDRFKLHLITLKNKNIQYYNQFTIKSFSDYIKYIMLVMNGLKHDQKTSDVVLWGYLGKQSPHYEEFYKFIKNISFGDRPDYLNYGFIFDEVQDHHYFDLYSAYLCE